MPAALPLVLLIAACGTSASQTSEPSATASVDATVGATPAATPVEGRFAVAEDGRELVLLCEGEGSPTVVLEDGHPSETGGIARFSNGAVWAALAAETRVCAYDRAGWGDSDAAPNEPRDADDVTDDLNALLRAAGEEPPYVLVGSSFGGMIVTHYASRFPDDVAAVVLLDVPAPTDALTVEEVPELAWDHPTNPEHVDIAPEFETRFALEPVAMEAPLLVITAASGQSSKEDQAYWLQISPDPSQIEVEGGHNVDHDAPDQVAEEILAIVAAAR